MFTIIILTKPGFTLRRSQIQKFRQNPRYLLHRNIHTKHKNFNIGRARAHTHTQARDNTDFQRCHWPCKGRWDHRILVCGICIGLEKNRVSNRPPRGASRGSGGRRRRCSPWRRWTPPAPWCPSPLLRRESPFVHVGDIRRSLTLFLYLLRSSIRTNRWKIGNRNEFWFSKGFVERERERRRPKPRCHRTVHGGFGSAIW